MKSLCVRSIVSFLIAGATVTLSMGQAVTGTPPFASFSGGPFDLINLASLNSHFGVPVIAKPGRGMSFSYTLSYDSSIWSPVANVWTPVQNWGWRGVTEVATGYLTYRTQMTRCAGTTISEGLFFWTYSGFVYHDAFG